jgi:succinyl-diaminopimelate desuccinylase
MTKKTVKKADKAEKKTKAVKTGVKKSAPKEAAVAEKKNAKAVKRTTAVKKTAASKAVKKTARKTAGKTAAKAATPYQAAASAYEKEALESLKAYVSINSVFDQKTVSPDKPFGQGVRNALDYIGNLGQKMGFHVDWCDHYCTELSFGEGPLIDVYAHSDVVPVSPNWATDPFKPTIIGKEMHCRGCADDKGPGIAALYGAKALLDQGKIQGYKLRIIFGGDEERGSQCLDHYLHALNKGYPAYGFSPDADYPLIFAEKGIFSYEADYALNDPRIAPFSYGNASNIVLDEVYLPVADPSLFADSLQAYKDKYPEIKADLTDGKLHFKGKAAHGSVPWDGINAGLHLLNFLGIALGHENLRWIYDNYHAGDGKAFHGDFRSAYFTGSSYCIGLMSYDGKTLKIIVNMRLPENVTGEKGLRNAIKNTHPATAKLLGGSPALIMDPKSDFIQDLLHVYQEETGDKVSQPLAIGGGTYARESKNSVAFGMEFPGVDCQMHGDGEFMRLEDFYKSIAIYMHAIDVLGALAKKGR